MPGSKSCPQCGGPLAADALEGLCPKCLGSLSFGPEDPLGGLDGAKPDTPSRIRYFGDYELLAEIARGGSGVVYKARQVSLNRLVAVKMLLIRNLGREEFVRRFKAEAEAAALLQHPNIVRIHEVGEHEGQHYFSMDYVEGQSLAERANNCPFSAKSAAECVKSIAEAIHYAHQRGILHRDLKPSNILIDHQGQPRITDFGLAKRLGDDQDLTLSGQVMGTPHYMAPEQARGLRAEITVATDVYGLGAILYYVITGQAPFMDGSMEGVLHRVVHDEPVVPRLLNPGVPRDLETVCLKCMQKEATKRYASAQVVADDLARYLRGEPVHARRVSPAERLWRLCRRRPAIAGLVVALILAVAAGLTGVLWQWGRARRSAEEAQLAQRETTTNLWHSYLLQARANRLSVRIGRRFGSLDALAKAAAIRPSPELRDEAIAALALTDVRLTNDWVFRHGGGDIGVLYSPNLDFYVVNGTNGEGRMHRTVDNTEIGHLPSVGHSISGVGAFSPDGRWLASLGSYGRLHVWDVPARKLILTNLPDSAWAFTPDSRQLLVAGRDGRASLYDLELTMLSRRFPSETVVHGVAAIDPLGRWVAGGAAEPKVVALYDLASGQSIRRFTNSAEPNCLAWRPDGQLLAAGGLNGMLEVWDVQTGERRAKLKGHEDTLVAVGFNRAGALLASSGWDNSWRLWDARDWRQSLVLPSISYQVQFSADDRMSAYINHTGGVHCLEFAPADCFRPMPPKRAVSNSGRNLDLSSDGRLALVSHLEGLTLWDLSSGRELVSVPNGVTTAALFTPDGRSIMTSCTDGVVRWPLNRKVLATGEDIRIGNSQRIGEGNRRYADISADGRWGCAAYDFETNCVEVFRLDDPTKRIPLGYHTGACSVAFSPDGRWLATGTWAHHGVKVWDLAAHKVEHEFSELLTATVEFSPDGRWLVAGSHPVQLWEVGSWRKQWCFENLDSNSPWIRVAFSPKSDVLAVVVRERDIALLEAANGRLFANMESPDRPSLVCLRFTPDGTKLVALQNDLGLQVWDLRHLRLELAKMNLDWETPAYPAEQPPAADSVLPISITLEKAGAAQN